MIERDLYLAAMEMLDKFGEDAVIRAAERADELLAAGDMDGVAAWKRVLQVIDELTSTDRGAAPLN